MTGFISTNLFLALLWWGKWKKVHLDWAKKAIHLTFLHWWCHRAHHWWAEDKDKFCLSCHVRWDATILKNKICTTPLNTQPLPPLPIPTHPAQHGDHWLQTLTPSWRCHPCLLTRGGVRRSQTLQQQLFGELDPLQRRGILCRRSYALLSRNLPGWGHQTRTPSSPVSLHREQQHWLLRVDRISSHLNYPSCLLSLL